MGMARNRYYRVPHEQGHFFLYLWVVRGLSLPYAIRLTRALGWSPQNYNSRTARGYYRSYQLHHWEFAEEEPGFDLWAALGVTA